MEPTPPPTSEPICFVTFQGPGKAVLRGFPGLPKYASLKNVAEYYFGACDLTLEFNGIVFSLEDEESVADLFQCTQVGSRITLKVTPRKPSTNIPKPAQHPSAPQPQVEPAGHFILVRSDDWLPKFSSSVPNVRVLGSWDPPSTPRVEPSGIFADDGPAQRTPRGRAAFFSSRQ